MPAKRKASSNGPVGIITTDDGKSGRRTSKAAKITQAASSSPALRASKRRRVSNAAGGDEEFGTSVSQQPLKSLLKALTVEKSVQQTTNETIAGEKGQRRVKDAEDVVDRHATELKEAETRLYWRFRCPNNKCEWKGNHCWWINGEDHELRHFPMDTRLMQKWAREIVSGKADYRMPSERLTEEFCGARNLGQPELRTDNRSAKWYLSSGPLPDSFDHVEDRGDDVSDSERVIRFEETDKLIDEIEDSLSQLWACKDPNCLWTQKPCFRIKEAIEGSRGDRHFPFNDEMLRTWARHVYEGTASYKDLEASFFIDTVIPVSNVFNEAFARSKVPMQAHNVIYNQVYNIGCDATVVIDGKSITNHGPGIMTRTYTQT